jgi:signal transduction histidine kinase
VLDERREGLERFVARGLDDAAHRAIGELPRGRGVLGALIDDPRPLRLHRVGDHPRSYGFPAGHPPMDTFLGVPIRVRGQAWGNLYLTEKAGGADFDAVDEETAVVLADWAAIAVENARLYHDVDARRAALEEAVLGLEATTQIARAVGGETDLERVLELIVKRGRALVRARALVIVLLDGDELAVAAGAGDVDPAVVGRRGAIPARAVERVLRTQAPERVGDVPARLHLATSAFGAGAPRTALLVPLVFRGRSLGVLAAFDHTDAALPFTAGHERLMGSFAASAATAVATARTVAAERLRGSLDAAERERRRWARELHDETLQALGGLRVLLAGGLRRGDDAALEGVVRDAVDQLSTEIDALRTLITELRPAALDEFGLQPALETLLDRVRTVEGLEIDAELRLGERLSPDLETAAYRLVQEALSNVAKHARADRVRIAVAEHGDELALEVADDGAGLRPGGADGRLRPRRHARARRAARRSPRARRGARPRQHDPRGAPAAARGRRGGVSA